jgi:hypothetical protein
VSREQSTATIERFRASCAEHDLVVAAFLGGSYAAGCARPDSDIDLYVVTKLEDYTTFIADRQRFIPLRMQHDRTADPPFSEHCFCIRKTRTPARSCGRRRGKLRRVRRWSGADNDTERILMHPKTMLDPVIADHIAAVNAFDTDAIVATFAPDAYVNDARREINGTDAIRRWVDKEMVGDHVTMDVREVLDHHGDTIVRARYDGTYDKTNLPDELVMSNYFSVRDGKIVSLSVIFNQPSPY